MRSTKTTAWALAGASLMATCAMAQGLGDKTLELPRDVVSAAAAFDDYIRGAAAIGGFSDVASVAEGVRRGVAYQPAQLEEGMIAP